MLRRLPRCRYGRWHAEPGHVGLPRGFGEGRGGRGTAWGARFVVIEFSEWGRVVPPAISRSSVKHQWCETGQEARQTTDCQFLQSRLNCSGQKGTLLPITPSASPSAAKPLSHKALKHFYALSHKGSLLHTPSDRLRSAGHCALGDLVAHRGFCAVACDRTESSSLWPVFGKFRAAVAGEGGKALHTEVMTTPLAP